MTRATVVLLVLAAGTYVLKAAGPVLLGGRSLPAWLADIVALLPAPLLAALVATSVLVGAGQGWPTVDERLAGVVVAGLVLARGGGFVPTVLAAAVTTALLRLVL